jgi:glycosyltransferase involved in cell wall biosynthesis
MDIGLTLLTFTYNAASELKQLLQAMVGYVDEIIIVDSNSSDGTPDIARKYGAKVYRAPRLGYQDPLRPYGLKLCTNDWVINVDVDESPTKALLRGLRNYVKQAERLGYVAISVPFINIGLGGFIGWTTDKVKIFNRKYVEFKGLVHEVPEVKGRVMRLSLPNAIIHRYLNRGFLDRLRREAQYLYLAEITTKPTLRRLHILPNRWVIRKILDVEIPRPILALVLTHRPVTALIQLALRYRRRLSAKAIIYYTLYKTMQLIPYVTRNGWKAGAARIIERIGVSELLRNKIRIEGCGA